MENNAVGTGSGFFFNFLEENGRYVPAIVTNKHVISGARSGVLHLTKVDDQGDPLIRDHVRISIEKFEANWLHHPDERVDLCVMPIARLLSEMEQSGHHFFFRALDASLIPSQDELDDLGALEDVVMLGYPNGIWDHVNNMPIIRRGVTATHPNLDYEGRREFMIDAACFPGSSGSPVLLYNDGPWLRRDGNVVMGGLRIRLLGLLYAGPQHTASGDIEIINVPTQQRAVAISRIPNNLGLIIKSSRILEMEDVLRNFLQKS
ncbi:S1 family peptidase [Xanthomonas arboricola]|uniref:S1 family peptidase n=1 Tax=Xanthomonas arboricola TaxID=56448 RepID=UPI001C63E4F1|nr:serine protease [Xanthomonas arboricola]